MLEPIGRLEVGNIMTQADSEMNHCEDSILYQFCTYEETGICEAENFKDVIPDDDIWKELTSE